MSDAVAACHDQQVFHHDLQPKNFIMTDGWNTAFEGKLERRFVVKLTNFGSATELSSTDCGTALYVSFGGSRSFVSHISS